jgi:Holliday junction resolvasome RuvABC endonuclease subunit
VVILALDPATKTGWAYGGEHGVIASGTWDLSFRRDESGGMRIIRFRSKLRETCLPTPPGLVVFEAARHTAPKMQGALVVQAELQGALKSWLEEQKDAGLKIEYRGYSPKEIKKHATGKGNASKEQVIAAAMDRWPTLGNFDDNEADALWLWDLAMSEYGGVTEVAPLTNEMKALGTALLNREAQ